MLYRTLMLISVLLNFFAVFKLLLAILNTNVLVLGISITLNVTWEQIILTLQSTRALNYNKLDPRLDILNLSYKVINSQIRNATRGKETNSETHLNKQINKVGKYITKGGHCFWKVKLLNSIMKQINRSCEKETFSIFLIISKPFAYRIPFFPALQTNLNIHVMELVRWIFVASVT